MSDMWPIPEQAPHTLFDVDDEFHTLYECAQKATQMGALSNPLRRQRFYVLYNMVRHYPWPGTLIRGARLAEVGCFRGLSTYILATGVEDRLVSRFSVFDSFEGLSERTKQDEASIETAQNFVCSLEQVRKNLSQFNFIKFFKGWIPECFDLDPSHNTYDFVHIDVDLYEPTRRSVMYFLPLLARGGTMVVDDYGYVLQFPGAKKAVDQCLTIYNGERIIQTILPTGQIILTRL